MTERVKRRGPGNPQMQLQRPGHSLNPGGRPTLLPGWRDGCRAFWLREDGLEILKAMARKKPVDAEDRADRRFALTMLRDDAWGKPVQAVLTADLTPKVTVIAAPSPRTLDLQAREIES